MKEFSFSLNEDKSSQHIEQSKKKWETPESWDKLLETSEPLSNEPKKWEKPEDWDKLLEHYPLSEELKELPKIFPSEGNEDLGDLLEPRSGDFVPEDYYQPYKSPLERIMDFVLGRKSDTFDGKVYMNDAQTSPNVETYSFKLSADDFPSSEQQAVSNTNEKLSESDTTPKAEKVDSADKKVVEITDENRGKITKLEPNTIYQDGQNLAETDEFGRLVKSVFFPVLTDDTRTAQDRSMSRKVGKEGGRGEYDQDGRRDNGGHIQAHILGGVSDRTNLVPQDENLNKSAYKKIENSIKKDLEQGKEVVVIVEVKYDDNTKRPSSFTVTKIVDGIPTTYGPLKNEPNSGVTKNA